MIRFLSEEWIEAFDEALRGAEAPEETGSIRAGSGTYSVEQQVRDVPWRDPAAGPLRMVLSVEDGRVSVGEAAGDVGADVVISLGYADAAALSRGELDPTEALASGRVHVRGDLAVLVAGQALMATAAGRGAALQADTEY
jgi:hypothetical protein